MPFAAFEPVRPNLPVQRSAPIQVQPSGECTLCSEPAKVGALCRGHYFTEVAAGRGKRWRRWYQRPGLYVPPVIYLWTGLMFTLWAGPKAAFYFLIIIPTGMYLIIFGRNRTAAEVREDNAHRSPMTWGAAGVDDDWRSV